MFRVVLKADTLRLKIKETVETQIIIRKGGKSFLMCQKNMLVNGVANINKNCEFYIVQNGKFTIEVVLVIGALRKLGGIVTVVLQNYAINSSHRIVQTLEKSPLAHSTIELDFMYMSAKQDFKGEEIISIHEEQQKNYKQKWESLNKANSDLNSQNIRLTEQVQILKSKNIKLESQKNEIQNENKMIEEENEEKIKEKQWIKKKCIQNLEKEKRKVAEIVDMVNESGDMNLISEIENFISDQRNTMN